MKTQLSTESVGMLKMIAELELVHSDANIVIDVLVGRYFECAYHQSQETDDNNLKPD